MNICFCLLFWLEILSLRPGLAILLRPFGLWAPIDFLNYLVLSIPDEGYSRNLSSTLNLIATLFFQMEIQFLNGFLSVMSILMKCGDCKSLQISIIRNRYIYYYLVSWPTLCSNYCRSAVSPVSMIFEKLLI